ncbi:TPA: portal protein [Citrobacter werkmanii]
MENDDFHATALARFNAAYGPAQGVREMCSAAARFCWIPGSQYKGQTLGGSKYDDLVKNYPKFEINKVRGEVLRIIGEYQNSRIAAQFRPSAGDASEELADKLNGKLKADAQDSLGTEARENAFKEGVSSGYGCYRLTTTAEDDEDEDGPRRVVFSPVYDAVRAVWFDPDSKTPDKSDSKYALEIYSMTPQRYKQEYKTDPASMATVNFGLDNFDWYSADVVYVAKYYERKLEPTTLLVYRNPLTGHTVTYDQTQIEQVTDELSDIGYEKITEKKAKRWNVYVSVIDGEKVLEQPVRIPGQFIPLVPFYGHRNYIDNIERITGHVQASMDSQRLYNMGLSIVANTAANGGKQRPIVYNEEVAGFEDDWTNADADDLPYVRLGKPAAEQTNQDYRPSIVGFTPLAQVPPAVTELMQTSASDITQTANAGQSNQEVPNNVASETVASFMGRSDMQSYIYMSNMAQSERHAARIWLSMAREVYGSDRVVRIVLPDGSDEMVTLSVQIMDQETGDVIGLNDISSGKYDVAIDVGPSFVTQRQATVAMLVELLKATPQNNPYYNVLYAMLIQNVYAPGMEPLKEFNNKMMLQEGITKPKTPEDVITIQRYQQSQQQAAASSPEAQLVQAKLLEAKAKSRSSIADLIEARAKTFDTWTDAWLKEAQSYHYIKGADAASISATTNTIKTMSDLAMNQISQQFPLLTGA